MINRFAGTAPHAAPPHPDLARLTEREREILSWVATGRSNEEIAGELVVAVSTVDRHITHLYGKLGLRNRAEATAYALKHGLGRTS